MCDHKIEFMLLYKKKSQHKINVTTVKVSFMLYVTKKNIFFITVHQENFLSLTLII